MEMTPWAKGLADERERREHVDDPYGYCLPPGVAAINNIVAFKLVPTPKLTVILYETSVGLMFRQAFTDGRPLPEVTSQHGSGTRLAVGTATRLSSTAWASKMVGGWIPARRARTAARCG